MLLSVPVVHLAVEVLRHLDGVVLRLDVALLLGLLLLLLALLEGVLHLVAMEMKMKKHAHSYNTKRLTTSKEF